MSDFENADELFTSIFSDDRDWEPSNETSTANWFAQFFGEAGYNETTNYPVQLQETISSTSGPNQQTDFNRLSISGSKEINNVTNLGSECYLEPSFIPQDCIMEGADFPIDSLDEQFGNTAQAVFEVPNEMPRGLQQGSQIISGQQSGPETEEQFPPYPIYNNVPSDGLNISEYSASLKTTAGLQAPCFTLESRHHLQVAIPPVIRPLVPRQKKTRPPAKDVQPDETLRFTRAYAEKPGVCMQCKKKKKWCSGAAPNRPCESCKANCAKHLEDSSNSCIKAAFYEIVEWGSFFEATAIYEHYLIHGLKNPHAIYNLILQDLKKVANSVPYITLLPIEYTTAAEVKVSTLLQITKTAFGVLDNGGFRWPALSSRHLTSAILSESPPDPQQEFVTFKTDAEMEDMTLLQKSLYFCSARGYGSSTQIGIQYEITQPTRLGHIVGRHLVLDFASYIAARYLELRMFRSLQDFSTSTKSLSQPEKAQDAVSLVLKILAEGLRRPVSWSAPWSLADTVKAEMSISLARTELIERQQQIRRALRIFVITREKALSTSSDVWADVEIQNPFFKTELRASFIAHPELFKDALRNRFIEHLFPPRDILSTGRDAILRILDVFRSYLLDVKTDATNFPPLFYMLGMTFLEDMNFHLILHAPIQALGSSWRRSLLVRRFFIGLANLGWHANVKGIQIQGFSSVLENIQKRRRLISTWRAIEKTYEMSALGTQTYYLYAYRVVQAFGLSFEKAMERKKVLLLLRIGKRWNELVIMFGEAIILIGSPLVDDALGIDLPRIVDEAVDEVFWCVKGVLATYFWWLTETCGQLREVLGMLAGLKSGESINTKEIESKISPVVKRLHPIVVLAAELRSMVSGTSPRELVNRLLLEENNSLRVLQDLAICTTVFMEKLESRCPQTEDDIKKLGDTVISTVMRTPSLKSSKTQIEGLVSSIISALWVFEVK